MDKPLRRSRIAKRPKASRKKLARYADSLWSQIVRRRETGCVDTKAHACAGAFQAAHGFSRRYHATRWNLLNGFKLCAGAHVRYTYDPLAWDAFLREWWGEALYTELRTTAQGNAKQDLPQIVTALEAVLHTGSDVPQVQA